MFLVEGDSAELAWARPGLPQLLSLLWQAAVPESTVSRPTGAVPQRADPQGLMAFLSQTRQAHPHAWLCTGAVGTRGDQAWLRLGWMAPAGTPQVLEWAGTSLPQLALDAAGALGAQPTWWPAWAQSDAEAVCAWADAVARLDPAAPGEGLARLQQRLARLPRRAALLMMQAELLFEHGRFTEALQAARDAEDFLTLHAPDDLDPLLHALSMQVRVAVQLGDPEVAEHHVAHAFFLAEQRGAFATPNRHATHLLRHAAYLRREQGDLPQAHLLLERAIAAACASQQRQAALQAQALQGQVLNWLGQTDRAAALLQRVIQDAAAGGWHEAETTALLVLCQLENARGGHAKALLWAERGLALASAAGPARRRTALAQLFESLLGGGDLDRATAVLAVREAEAGQGDLSRLGPMANRAMLLWRQGRLDESALAYTHFIHAMGLTRYPVWAGVKVPELAIVLSLLHRPDEASRWLDQLHGGVHPLAEARARAAVAMAKGQRAHARQGLTLAMASWHPGQEKAVHVAQDLAWLCLEDQAYDEAARWLDRLGPRGGTSPASRWIRNSLDARTGQDDPREWPELRRDSPALLRRAPTLGTPDDVRRRCRGQAAPLPNLLTVLAW